MVSSFSRTLFLFCFCVIGLMTHWSCSETTKQSLEKGIRFTNQKILIDGKETELAWQIQEWKPINEFWIGEPCGVDDFKGNYKVLWDAGHLYVLAEIYDNFLKDTYKDGLERYWDDDCLEVFIDEDASGGDHQYNYNAFAYHIALNRKVTDIGTDSLPHYYDDHIEVQKRTKGKRTLWELAIKVYDDTFELGQKNKPRWLKEHENIGFAIAYCDNDSSEEREHFIGNIPIEGEDKNRGWIDAGVFETLSLLPKMEDKLPK